MGRRCVCGRSATFPSCDGSHGDAWSCADSTRRESLCVVAGPHLASLGERLAHELGGVVAHRIEGPIHAAELIALTDGTDLAQLSGELKRLTGERRTAIAVETPASTISQAFAGWSLRQAWPNDPLHLWRAVRAAVSGAELAPAAPPSLFLSHAVADEPVLQPVVDYLRRYSGASVFLCADSIQPGDAWRQRIDAELRAADRFVLVGSAASFASTYCAFEAGAALALGKPCLVIVLDGTPPPAFVGHIQAVDLKRHQARRPWLSAADALTDALAEALGELPAVATETDS